MIGTRDEFRSYMCGKHRVKGEIDIPPDKVGGTFIFDAANGSHSLEVIWLPQMDFTTWDYMALAHECDHAAMDILEQHGMKLGDDSMNHAYIYFKGAIYLSFLNQLHRDRKKAESTLKKAK